MRQKTIILTLSILFFLCGCASWYGSSSGDELVVTSLCQLIEDSDKFAGRRVHLKSKVRPSSHSVISLYDDECDDAVVVLDISSTLEGTPAVEKTMQIVWEGYPAPMSNNAVIELYGIYRSNKSTLPMRYIIVERVIDIARGNGGAMERPGE